MQDAVYYVLPWNKSDSYRRNDIGAPYSLDRAIQTARQTVPFGRAEAEQIRRDLLADRRADSAGRYGQMVSIYPASHWPGEPQNAAEAEAWERCLIRGGNWQDWVTR
jgi:hypothetical protein